MLLAPHFVRKVMYRVDEYDNYYNKGTKDWSMLSANNMSKGHHHASLTFYNYKVFIGWESKGRIQVSIKDIHAHIYLNFIRVEFISCKKNCQKAIC